MEVLKIPHILDQIIHHLYHLDIYDYYNILIALKLEKVYTLRQLNIAVQDAAQNKKSNIPLNQWRLGNLLKISIPYFTSDEIRSNFNIIWENIDLIPFNEKFFIENYDLIDHKKLLCLVDWDFDFSKDFHDRFPTFRSLKVCSNFYACQTEIFEGQICSNCYNNKCPTCHDVMLPKLILFNGVNCDSCSDRREYKYFYDSD